MVSYAGKFLVIQARSTKFFIIQIKAQGVDQVKFKTGISTQSNNVAGVGRNFWLIKYNMKIKFFFFSKLLTIV